MQSNLEKVNGANRPLPRGPVLDWSSFVHWDAPNVHSVENLKNKIFTTSGRAAIYQALLQLNLPAYSLVLIPTYHCPTMVAPVLLANLKVHYFELLPNGLPNLESIEESTAQKCKVMLVPHYFGLAKSLKEVREWCDKWDVALIEDCAHCYFGQAGERAVGEWGDFATASLSKFFPLPEAGLLASAQRSIKSVALKRPSLKAQIKGYVDVVELASKYHRFIGIQLFLKLLFKLKRIYPLKSETVNKSEATEMMRDCDMARIDHAPLWTALTLKNILPRGRIIIQRQINFAKYASHFSNITGAKPLFPIDSKSLPSTAPYVFPLWVDDPDWIYQSLRDLKLPVFRWDRIWPKTPSSLKDTGTLWSHHVLQLLCHQDLSVEDIDRTAQALLHLLKIQQAKLRTTNT